MKNFWESSPLWRRKQELAAVERAAMEARDEAGVRVLACVLHDAVAPDGDYWRGCRQAYQDAHAEWREASDAWFAAYKAFHASPVGKARARFIVDPLAFREAETVAEEAAA